MLKVEMQNLFNLAVRIDLATYKYNILTYITYIHLDLQIFI